MICAAIFRRQSILVDCFVTTVPGATVTLTMLKKNINLYSSGAVWVCVLCVPV